MKVNVAFCTANSMYDLTQDTNVVLDKLQKHHRVFELISIQYEIFSRDNRPVHNGPPAEYSALITYRFMD